MHNMPHTKPQGFTRSVDSAGLFGLSFVSTGSRPLFPGTSVTMSAQSDAHKRAVEDAVTQHKGYMAVLCSSKPQHSKDNRLGDVATLVVITDYTRKGGRLRFSCKAIGRLHIMRTYDGDRLDAAPMSSAQGCTREAMHVLGHLLPSLDVLSKELYADIHALVRASLPCGELADQLTALTCTDRQVAMAQLHELDEQRRLACAMDGLLRLVATLKHHLDAQGTTQVFGA